MSSLQEPLQFLYKKICVMVFLVNLLIKFAHLIGYLQKWVSSVKMIVISLAVYVNIPGVSTHNTQNSQVDISKEALVLKKTFATWSHLLESP